MSALKIVVVGAGAVGLACALKLAQRGGEVTLIDGEVEHWEARGATASRAAAGMIGPISEARHAPANAHPLAVELALASYDLWRALAPALLTHARFNGALLLTDEPARAASEIVACGRGVEIMSRAQIARRFGLEARVEQAVFTPDEGAVDPIPTLRVMAEAFAAAGGRLHFDIEALSIETRPYRRVRCLEGQTFTADRIVLAPGMWASNGLEEAAPALKRLRPAKGVLAPITLARGLAINVRGPDFYLSPRGVGEAVLGATMEFDRTDRFAAREQVDALLAAAENMLPGQVRLTDAPAWAGVRPMSPDWSPMIGPDGAPGVLIAAGHSRNGWLLAPITAEIIAAHVFEDAISPLWAAFAPRRFE